MRILVTFALESEFAPWRALQKFHSAVWGRADVYVAQVCGSEVGVILTGVGPRQAARRFGEVLRSEYDSITACISSGVAGALKNEYSIGQVLAASAVLSEDRPEEVRRQFLRSSGALLSFAGECGATVAGRFYTAARVITTSEEKQELSNIADAVEMESFEILSEAAAFGVPAVAIRAVSDVAAEDLPFDLNQVLTGNGQVSVPRVLGQVTLHPASVPALVKLGQQSKRAAESLAQFLDRYVAMLAERAKNLEVKAATL